MSRVQAKIHQRRDARLGRPRPNFAARLAADLTAWASKPAPGTRWLVMLVLLIAWLVAGTIGWGVAVAADPTQDRTGYGLWLEAVYRTLGALAVSGEYVSVSSWQLELARFAGLFLPLVGIFFAFYQQVLHSLARIALGFAAGHVVVGGAGPVAISLAEDVVTEGGVVVMVGSGIPHETAEAIRRRGVILLEADPRHRDALEQARVRTADHLVALDPDDQVNLTIEAAARRSAARRGQDRVPLSVHVGLKTPILLSEARRLREGGRADDPRLDPRPFSLDELAARALITHEGPVILENARVGGHDRPHLVVFGFDPAAEACVTAALSTLWSCQLGPPRVTVVGPDCADAERRFAARYPQARAHAGLALDIQFLPFDWHAHPVDLAQLQALHAQRGPATALVVSTGSDADNIGVALALKRACNETKFWPAPIYMKETNQTEFSKTFASGDETEEHDAYIQAFGSMQTVATFRLICDGQLDRGAGTAHKYYELGSGERAGRKNELEAAGRNWREVKETYRVANRAVADSALVKLWDGGWRPAQGTEVGDEHPTLPDGLILPLAEVEHARWCAERVLAGWQPGQPRDNVRRIHPSLKPWADLSQGEKDKDVTQVSAAVEIATLFTPQGFVRLPR
jgi:hypothetical protein